LLCSPIKYVEHDFLLRELDTIQVRGRSQGAQIFEVLAESKSATPEQIRIKSDYEAALALNRKGEFIRAEESFTALFITSNDILSRSMAERCREFIATPPENWLGLVVMKEK
jgi:hypothetical protein